MATATSYDEMPYPSLAYAQSHPDRLATVARLMGMHPAPVDGCRVLELGCAGGGNLIPMAYGLPGSEFVGIDNAMRQIGEGQSMIQALGLENVTLRCQDILEMDTALGQFDYIIAHGLFSWVPRPVQEKVLEICSAHLARDGVAYVSYNTYPGWHFVGAIREMMLYHTRELAEPVARAREAWALLSFLAEAVPAESGPYGGYLNAYAEFLKDELKGPQGDANALLLHDELEEVNEPIYFHQFAERAAAHGLQYLGEAEFSTMVGSQWPAPVRERIDQMARSVVDLEQYMDFLANRTLRQTLLCHQGIPLSRVLHPERLQDLYFCSRAESAEAAPDIQGTSVVQFVGADGASLSIDHPLTKVVMMALQAVWPAAMSFDVLLSMGQAALGRHTTTGRQEGDRDLDRLTLGADLLQAYGYSASLVELHTHAPQIALQVSDRPLASAVARYQAQSGTRVTNLRHERVILDQIDLPLLCRLDGRHDHSALVQELIEGAVAQGALRLERDGQPIEDPQEMRRLLVKELDRRLRWFARAALLEG